MKVTVVLLLLHAACAAHAADAERASAQIGALIPLADTLMGASALAHGGSQALEGVYSKSGNAPLWLRSARPTAQAEALLRELQGAESYGLESKDYNGDAIGRSASADISSADSNDVRLARFDVALSAAAVHFLSDLHYGRVTAEAAGFELREARVPLDMAVTLKNLSATSDMHLAIAAVEPTFRHYGLLKDALQRLRTIERQQVFTQLPLPNQHLRVNDDYAGAAVLRNILSTLGDLPEDARASPTGATFDPALSTAVLTYQLRHGLAGTGLLDKATFLALSASPARRSRQIVLTLERWRWLSPFKTPPIVVNIPEFKLFAFRTVNDLAADILPMDVIVGRTYPQARTPVFEGIMRYVVLRPYWDVPYNITRHELLPKIRANPTYMSKEHLEIATGTGDDSSAVATTSENLNALAAGKLRLRQRPGADNALGLIKFMFPNSYNVYLHSTPADGLFNKPVRAFSHGCIRVSDPVALAALVLKDAPGDWTREKIQAVMNGSATVRVNLKNPVDVLILYATALATEAGPIMFFEDIYGYDKKLERQLGLEPIK